MGYTRQGNTYYDDWTDDDWTDVRNDRSQPSPASGRVVSVGGEAAEAQAVQLTSKLSGRPPHGP